MVKCILQQLHCLMQSKESVQQLHCFRDTLTAVAATIAVSVLRVYVIAVALSDRCVECVLSIEPDAMNAHCWALDEGVMSMSDGHLTGR